MTPEYRMLHIAEMPLGLVGKEWEPGGKEFEKARTRTANAISRLNNKRIGSDQIMDWEVRSYLRERHYGDASLAGLHAAVNAFHNKEA